jgi:hypothetical protein
MLSDINAAKDTYPYKVWAAVDHAVGVVAYIIKFGGTVQRTAEPGTFMTLPTAVGRGEGGCGSYGSPSPAKGVQGITPENFLSFILISCFLVNFGEINYKLLQVIAPIRGL